MNSFEIKLNFNYNLHSDIVVVFNDETIEEIDSYYLFGGQVKEDYELKLRKTITKILSTWLEEVDKVKDRISIFFILDHSDQYVGGFRIVVSDDERRLDYGIFRAPYAYSLKSISRNFDNQHYQSLYTIDVHRPVLTFVKAVKASLSNIQT